MVSADTNVVVRFLTGDDNEQYQKAFELFEQEIVFLSDTVILETAWVPDMPDRIIAALTFGFSTYYS